MLHFNENHTTDVKENQVSPLYDVNPVPYGDELSFNIDSAAIEQD